MQPEKFQRCIITARQAEEEDKLPEWVVTIGNMAFWLSIMLFVKAFVDAVDVTFK
ncbi:hypothetical protein [Sporomusa paucivorans]|uniref:hypothetical protein n=1 Tax=Sporomusa paucivorans TaxID=2376 RepID=UPI0035713B5F